MAEYLLSRAEPAPSPTTPADEIGVRLFFQMWAIRQDPFNRLADGDTLWWVDGRTRQICWELRVRNLHRSQYASRAQAMERLRRWFGLAPSEFNEYQHSARDEGWLLAWENELVAPVGLLLPAGEKLGRNGMRHIKPEAARSWGLPRPGRPAIIAVEAFTTTPDILSPPRTRVVPVAVQREVFDRDGRQCRECGTTEGPMHLDHVHPWSKGGPNTAANLQVLCRRCNLRKGAAAASQHVHLPGVQSLVELARSLGSPTPASPQELTQLLVHAVADGLDSQLIVALWDLYHHPDDDAEIDGAVYAGLVAASGPLERHARAFAALSRGEDGDDELRRLLDIDDEVSKRASAYLAWSDIKATSEFQLHVDRGLASSDARVRAVAHFARAANSPPDRIDDSTWADDLTFAVAHGSIRLAARAALLYGLEVIDDELAYEHLELALRSPEVGIAAEAAAALARRFADDVEVSVYYEEKARELFALAGEDYPN